VLIPETQPAWPQGWEQPKPLSSPATLPLQPQPAGG
jgi:hypothetical protein